MSEVLPSTADSLCLSAEQRIDAVCRRFEAAWQAGEQPAIQAYLDEVTPIERAALLREILAIDLVYRRLGGETPTPEEYRRHFPDQETLVQEVFEQAAGRVSTRTKADSPIDLDQASPNGSTPRYSAIRLHARGGLGEVHVARDSELHRTVALKRIQGRLASNADSRRRFLLEAEITSRLEHPGIVPVYGLVQDESGQPAYAMRFVEGENLKEATDRYHAAPERLTERQLLSHFVAACNAVAYAHSRGVIHRDLKPSNVLLGKFGETLVVDWGLAKVVGRGEAPEADGDGTLTTSHQVDGEATALGQAVGTPAYMSPEQAAGRWNVIGPASDVYSLGATLYYLLTGKAPYRGQDRFEVLARVQRGAFPQPRQLRKEVPAALNAICRRAMALEPELRYATATDLASDVELWLADEPVLAYPEPWTARTRRWARRHRTLVTGAATLLVTAVLTLSGSTARIAHLLDKEAQAKQSALEAEQEAAEAARREKKEAENAKEIADFLVKTFRTPDALGIEGLAFRRDEDQGKQLTASAILERGIDQSRRDFRDKPLLQAQLLDAVGHVYRSWADYPKAKSLLEEALRLRREVPASPLDLAVSLRGVGRCYHDLGHYEEAESHYRQALEIQLRYLPQDDPQVTSTEFNLAWLLAERKDPAGERLLHHVIDTRLRRGDQPRDLAVAQLAQAILLSEQGRSTDAIRVTTQAQQGLNADLALAVGHAITAVGSRRLGLLGPAMAGDDLALGLLRKHLGKRHPYVAWAQYMSTLTLLKAKKLGEAARRRQECLEIARETVGLGHPLAILLVQDHADYLAQNKAVAEGEGLYRELVHKRRELFGDRHPLIAEALARLAMYLADHGGQDRRTEARQLLGEANRILTSQDGSPSKYPYRMHFSWDEGAKAPAKIDYTIFSPDGRRYFATSADYAAAGVYDVTTGECRQEVGRHAEGLWAAAFRPDGRQLLTGDKQGTLRLWPVLTGGQAHDLARTNQEQPRIAGHSGPGPVHCVAFSRDGERFLSFGNDGAVRVWEGAGSRELAKFQGPPEAGCADFLPDGLNILSGHSDGQLRLWDVTTGKETRRFGEHQGPVGICAVAPDGKRALTYGWDQTVRVWDLARGVELQDRRRTMTDLAGFRGVAFSPDCRRCLSLHHRDRVLRLWDVDNGEEIQRFELHYFFRQIPGAPMGVSISPDGRYAACGSLRGLVYLFRLPE